jgi:hypothetical protein
MTASVGKRFFVPALLNCLREHFDTFVIIGTYNGTPAEWTIKGDRDNWVFSDYHMQRKRGLALSLPGGDGVLYLCRWEIRDAHGEMVITDKLPSHSRMPSEPITYQFL